MLPVEIAAVPSQGAINKAENIIRDKKDAVILAAAIENTPDAFVSGDKDFHTQEVRRVINVVSTVEAIEMVK